MTAEPTTLQQPPPPAPRAVTPRVRRRAWVEPVVRFWWLTAMVLVLIGAWFALQGVLEWRHDVKLIREGVAVDATVYQVGEMKGRFKHPQPPDSIVTLQFSWNGTDQYTKPDRLPDRKAGEFITPGDKIPIRVNPADPTDWTSAKVAGPISGRLFGAEVALPIAALTGAFALLKWRRLLTAWRGGQPIEALVMDSRNTALALGARLVRCTPDAEGDKRVFAVYAPRGLAGIGRGDTIWLLTCGRGAVACAWFE
jgi:hypothetical protein